MLVLDRNWSDDIDLPNKNSHHPLQTLYKHIFIQRALDLNWEGSRFGGMWHMGDFRNVLDHTTKYRLTATQLRPNV